MTEEFYKYIEDNKLDKKLMEEAGSIMINKFLFAKKDVEVVKDIYDLVMKYKS